MRTLLLALILVGCTPNNNQNNIKGLPIDRNPAYRINLTSEEPISVGLDKNEVMMVFTEAQKTSVNDVTQEKIVASYVTKDSSLSAQAGVSTSRSNVRTKSSKTRIVSVPNNTWTTVKNDILIACPGTTCDQTPAFMFYSEQSNTVVAIPDGMFGFLYKRAEASDLANGVNIANISDFQLVKTKEVTLQQGQELIVLDKASSKSHLVGHVTVVK